MEVNRNLREREDLFNQRLLSSHHKSIYMGSYEEISSFHRCYEDPTNKVKELLTTLQVSTVFVKSVLNCVII